MQRRVLVVETTPYNTSDYTRTYDAYFHFWDKDKAAQIFSRNWVPDKGYCAELYQITDARLLKRWLHKTKETGVIYHYDELSEQSGIKEVKDTASVGKLYSLGIKHSPIFELLREKLWRKKYWCTPQLDCWLDDFKPECVVYGFSNHVFFQKVALHVAEKYDIPIVTVIGDDFYFNDRFSLSLFYNVYRRKFKRLTEKILFRKGSSAIFCSDKIRDKYNDYFHIQGQTIYINSSVERRAYKAIDTDNPLFVYFGSIRLGRNNALLDIADALGKINSSYKIEVYSSEKDPVLYEQLKKHPNVNYGGSISYSEVQKKIAECDVFVIAEGFAPEDINFTRYSLSTKAADSLASGAAVLMYGPEEAGVVEYMKESRAAMVCTDPNNLKTDIEELINDINLQKQYYENAVQIYNNNHKVENTTEAFQMIIEESIIQYKKKTNRI